MFVCVPSLALTLTQLLSEYVRKTVDFSWFDYILYRKAKETDSTVGPSEVYAETPTVIWHLPLPWHMPHPWASAHRDKWGQLTPTPGKNGWKIKKRKHEKRQFSGLGWGWSDTSDDWLVKLMMSIVIIIDHYPSSWVFLFKFSKFSSPQVARGHWPPNQYPADALGHIPR